MLGGCHIEMSNHNYNNLAFIRFSNTLRSLTHFCTDYQPTPINSCITNSVINFNMNPYSVTYTRLTLFCWPYTRWIYIILFISALKNENWLIIEDFKQNKNDIKGLSNNLFQKYVVLRHDLLPSIKINNKKFLSDCKLFIC